jgi:predicted transcriptional regulator
VSAAGGRRALEVRIEGVAEALLKALTPTRWQLLERLAAEGPCSVYALAKRLQRDYKNVHTDVVQLVALGLIERREARVAVPWDAVRAELPLST